MENPQEITVGQLEARIKDNPKSLVFARLADLYLDEGRIDEAVALCNDSNKFHPYYVTGHFVLAKAYIAKKDLEKAEAELKKVLLHDQQYPAAHKLLGDILCKTNRESLAAAHYQDVLFMDPLEEKVQKALDRIPEETAAAASKEEPKREAPVRPLPRPEPRDESWVDQIKEFRPEDQPKTEPIIEARQESAASGADWKDPFSDWTAADEKAEPASLEGSLDLDKPVESEEKLPETTLPESAEPLIGEKPSDLPHDMDEALSPFIPPEMLPSKGEETVSAADALAAGQAEKRAIFDTPLTGITETEEPAAREESFPHSVFNEPGIMDGISVESEPTVLDEPPAEPVPKTEIQSDLSPLFDEPIPEVQPLSPVTKPIPPAREKPPAAVPAAEAPGADKKSAKIVTPTLGEIYAAQGQYDKAIEVYETLLAKHPGDKKFLVKIEEMKKRMKNSAAR